MLYAANLPNAGVSGDPRRLADLAELAEKAGWDAILLEDYIVYNLAEGQLPTYDPWVALAAMAMRTTRLRLGTLVTALPRRRPWKLAREVLTLDHLSGGRVTLGVGLGDAKTDRSFTRFGEARLSRLERRSPTRRWKSSLGSGLLDRSATAASTTASRS